MNALTLIQATVEPGDQDTYLQTAAKTWARALGLNKVKETSENEFKCWLEPDTTALNLVVWLYASAHEDYINIKVNALGSTLEEYTATRSTIGRVSRVASANVGASLATIKAAAATCVQSRLSPESAWQRIKQGLARHNVYKHFTPAGHLLEKYLWTVREEM